MDLKRWTVAAAFSAMAVGGVWGAVTGTIPLSGTGTRPGRLVVTPAALAFGAVDSGAVSILPFTLRNSGGGTLTGAVRKAAGCSPWFVLLTDSGSHVETLPYALGPGQSQSFLVAFAPAGVGGATCALEAGP